MKTQTIEQAVEKRFNGSNIFWKVILKNLTPETISFIKDDFSQALQAQRDAGAEEERERMVDDIKKYLELRPNSNTIICERIGAEGTVKEILEALTQPPCQP